MHLQERGYRRDTNRLLEFWTTYKMFFGLEVETENGMKLIQHIAKFAILMRWSMISMLILKPF